MLHLLIGIVALVWTLVGLWVLRRMWAISAAERRERKMERREQRAAQRSADAREAERFRIVARQREHEAAEAARARWVAEMDEKYRRRLRRRLDGKLLV